MDGSYVFPPHGHIVLLVSVVLGGGGFGREGRRIGSRPRWRAAPERENSLPSPVLLACGSFPPCHASTYFTRVA